jgi:ubiquitin-protein ligase E3 C
VAPFRVFPPTTPAYSDALTQVCSHLLVIPLFPNRIGIAALTQFSSQVPFGAFHLVSVHKVTRQLSDISVLHLLANLLTFIPPRYASASATSLNGKALETYIELLNNLINQLPIGSLERPKSKQVEPRSWASEDDSDEVVPKSQPKKPQLPAVHPPDNKTALKLATLVSQPHISSLLRVANKSAASWKQFVRLVINIATKWPSKRESLLTTMVIGGGNVVFKQLWRDSVRSSSLGRTPDPLLMKRMGNVEDWPPFLLLTELYTQALLTMGDDEFFSTTTSSSKVAAAKNPFSTGEVILFSRQLLNIVFPLYWNEDPESVKNSLVPGLAISWESVRDRITKCLQAIHARE